MAGLWPAAAAAQLRPGVFTTLQTTDTTANSLLVGCALGSTTCTGGVKAGQVSLSGGMAISGGTVSTAGIVIASAVPSSTALALYNDAGVLKWNGAALATGSSVSGTTNRIPVFTSATALGDSIMAQDGGATTITVTGTVNATTAFNLAGASINTTGTLTNVAYKAQNNSFTVVQTFAAGIGLSGGTPSTHGLMLPSGVPAVTTTNLHNASGILTWPGGMSLNASADSALAVLSLRGGGGAGSYTHTNSGIVFRDSAGDEIWRLWGSDPDVSNNNASNLYLGAAAGFSQPTDNVTAGYSNIGIGTETLYSIDEGYSNLGFGHFVLSSLTDGAYNAAFGENSMNSATTADFNSAFGSNTLSSVVTGVNNSAFGNNVLLLATGDNNTAVGDSALDSLVAGDNNTALGGSALTDLIGGNASNVGVGYRAGRSRTGPASLTLASQSIFIGAESRASANSNTNEIVIGYNADGQGTNTATIGNASLSYVFTSGAYRERGRSVAMGEWVDQAFNAANYTTSGGGGVTWGVDAGDVALNRYTLVGKTVTWQINIDSTDIAGGTPTHLRVAVPSGLTEVAVLARGGSCGRTRDAGGVVIPGHWLMDASGYVKLFLFNEGPWSATSADDTGATCTIVFEIA